jgi:hypothetical protein
MVTNSEGTCKEIVEEEIARGRKEEVENIKPLPYSMEEVVRPVGILDLLKRLIGRGEFKKVRKYRVKDRTIHEKKLAVVCVGGGYRIDVSKEVASERKNAERYIKDNLDYLERITGLKINNFRFWDYHTKSEFDND